MTQHRVYGVPWHTGHIHALSEIPCIQSYALQLNPWRAWSHASRPMWGKLKAVLHFDEDKYDVAILHLDHEALHPDSPKHMLTSAMIDALPKDFPRVFINHYVPTLPHHPEAAKALVGKWPMVCMSWDARDAWGFGQTIHHAYPPKMFDRFIWSEGPVKTPMILGFMPDVPQYEEDAKFAYEVDAALFTRHNTRIKWLGKPGAQCSDFFEFKALLAASSVYVHMHRNSPMPRTRTEAMLSGCTPVSLGEHDFDVLFPHWETERSVDAFVSAIEKALHQPMNPSEVAEETERVMSWPAYCDAWKELLEDVT